MVRAFEKPVYQDGYLVDRKHYRSVGTRQSLKNRVSLPSPIPRIQSGAQRKAHVMDRQFFYTLADIGENILESTPRTLYAFRMKTNFGDGVRWVVSVLQINKSSLKVSFLVE